MLAEEDVSLVFDDEGYEADSDSFDKFATDDSWMGDKLVVPEDSESDDSKIPMWVSSLPVWAR